MIKLPRTVANTLMFRSSMRGWKKGGVGMQLGHPFNLIGAVVLDMDNLGPDTLICLSPRVYLGVFDGIQGHVHRAVPIGMDGGPVAELVNP